MQTLRYGFNGHNIINFFLPKRLTHVLSSLGLICLLFITTTVDALVQPTFGSSEGPTLLPGSNANLTIGARYIYQDVETSTDGIVIDAVVTIVDISNSAIVGGTIDTTLGVNDRFEPLTNTSQANGYVEWRVDFVQDGTVTSAGDTGVRAYLDNFTMEAIDVDGEEFFGAIITNSYTVEGAINPATELVVSTSGGFTRFQSDTDFAPNISELDTEFIVRVNYQNVNSISFRNGSAVNSNDRQNSTSFMGEVTFISENTVVVNSPPVVVANTGNTIDVDSSFNASLLVGASDADGNIDQATVQLIDPGDFTNLGSVGAPLVVPGVGSFSVDALGDLSFTPVGGYQGAADILFTVSDDLGVSSNRASLGITVADITAPVVVTTSAPSVTLANQAAYPVSGTCTAGDGNVTVSIAGATPANQAVACNAGAWSASFDVSAIADGTDVIDVNANQTDAAGNTGNAILVEADKDTIGPLVVTTIAPTATLFNQAAYPVGGTCTAGDGDVTVSIAGAMPVSQAVACNAGNWSASFDVSAIGDGPDVIDVNASQTDTAGNTGNALLVEADKNSIPPMVAITSAPLATPLNQSAYPVTGTCTTGDGDVTVSITGATPASQAVVCNAGVWSANFDVTAIADGADVIDVNASQTDSGGNTGNALQVEASKDTTLPVLAIDPAVLATPLNQAAFPVTGTCTTGDGNVTVSIAGAIPASQAVACNAGVWSASFDVTAIADGSNVIDINASQTDAAGNTGNAALVEASKDTTPPVVAITGTPLATLANQAVYPVNGTCSAGEGDVTVSIAGATPASQAVACNAGVWSANFDVSAIADGVDVIDVDASQTDAAGNTGNAILSEADKDTVTVTVAILNAPVTTVGAFTVTIEFSTDVTGFEISELSVGNGSSSNFVAVDANTYTILITPDGGGNVTLDVSADVAQDIGANGNTAATQVTVSLTSDADNDGIPDSVECPVGPPFDATCRDSDGDGIPDFQDLDSDNDSIPDSVEAADNLNNPVDSDNDGTPNYLDLDSDNDGIPDHVEAGADPNNPVDTDGDGTPDYLDLDSDSDGIPDAVEGGATGIDTDSDGIDDAFDVDLTGGEDANGDGIDDNFVVDTDSDGIPDYQDLDSDNDGIPDAIEGGATGTDSDNDGIDDAYDVDQTGGTDANGDGIDDNAAPDTDGDGMADFQDTDSDNDGISDAVEGGSTGNDTDGDGIDDAYDVDQTGGTDANGDGIDDNATVDTDGDGLPDSQDPDSDNDGLPDSIEGAGGDIDSDGDGIPDILENSSVGIDTDGDGVDDALDVDETGGTDANADGIDDSVIDRDGDGIANYLDLDSDNDGIPDLIEAGSSGEDTNGNDIDDAFDFVLVGGIDANSDGIVDTMLDTDADSIPDVFDLDADADGISDLLESGLTLSRIATLDSDGNSVIDTAVGSNGLADAIETEDTLFAELDQNGDGTVDAPKDTDADNRPDFQDLDADNDGIHDLVEGGRIDPALVDIDNNGVIDDIASDADSDGISDSVDSDDLQFGSDSSSPVDTDGDLVADFRDQDSDSDGIFDLFEAGVLDPSLVDTDNDAVLDNPLTDADSDGIPDSGDSLVGYGDPQATAPVDTDSDGQADFRDLDSDNDSIADVTEAGNEDANADGLLDPAGAVTYPPIDTDSDGISDYIDTDSNNDATLDIDDAGNGGLDIDDDGRVDDITDADADGIADVVDVDSTGFGHIVDQDNDGIIDSLDLDDDNDGIPDSAEDDGNDIDTDGDGIVDRLDLDSDSDGLPDSVEATLEALDGNADGLLDNFSDTNNDGLDDRVDAGMVPQDTDADAIPDFRDLDSDNDSLMDVLEASLLNNALDINNDGLLDGLTDNDADGLADVVDPDVTGGVAGTALPNPDTDDDGLSNYRDTDSDGDGVSDTDEMVDDNGDGIIDGLQEGDELETAVRGTGSFDPMLLLLLLPVFLRIQKVRNSSLLATLLVILTGSLFPLNASAEDTDDINYCGRHNPINSEQDEDFNKCFYVGGSWLISTHVDPEGEAFGWSTSDDADSGYNLFVGWHFKPQWFGELSYADLGEAGLSNSNPAITGTEHISYKIPALHVGYYLFEPEARFNFYGKLGIANIRNTATTSRVPFEKQNSSNLSAGIGAQWRSATNGLFARFALDFYDRDASSVGLSLGYYFDGSDKQRPAVIPDTDGDGVLDNVDSCLDSATGISVDTNGCRIVPVPVPEPVAVEPEVEVDSDADGIIDRLDSCPDSARGALIDSTGCVKLSIEEINLSLEGVNFQTNSARLTADSKVILDKAVEAMRTSLTLHLEVQAHTDDRGAEQYNLDLSEQRAASVRRYLISGGISANRLTSKGYGEAKPKTSNETREGRARNRRVEFEVISNSAE